jgi:hypothetical protein
MSELSHTDLELHPGLLVILTSIKPLSKGLYLLQKDLLLARYQSFVFQLCEVCGLAIIYKRT